MAGGWGHVTDDAGRFTGAGSVESGGDVEELAQMLFGMIWWLAAIAAPRPTRASRLAIISDAEMHARDGFQFGGRSNGQEPAG